MAFRNVPMHLLRTIRAYRQLPPFRGHPASIWTLAFEPTYLAVAPSHEVFLSDYDNDCVHVLANDMLVRKWGSQGSAAGQFMGPSGIAVAKDGQVVVADQFNHRVQVFRPDGTLLRMWGSVGSGDGEFNYPLGVVVTKNDEVVVVDGGNHRVQVFRLSDGAFQRKWGGYGSADGRFSSPTCLTAADGDLFVTDSNNHRVQVFRMDGTFLRKWGSRGSGLGQFKTPWDVMVRDGKVLVADTGNHCLQMFRLNGAFLHTWKMRCFPSHMALHHSGVLVTSVGEGHVYVLE